MDNYLEMSYQELQAELKHRGLKASGKKNELIERLEQNDDDGYADEDRIREEEERNADTVLFHIKTLMGSWHDVRVRDDQTLLNVKEVIEARTGIPIDQIRLFERGMPFHDDTVAASFGYDGVFLDMMVRLRSKKKPKNAKKSDK
jgi:SAP domain-containing protein/ubiquitin domain-containing protein